jgi:uncharacterized membrane protein YdjX (TVP38/TMEM64 family)
MFAHVARAIIYADAIFLLSAIPYKLCYIISAIGRLHPIFAYTVAAMTIVQTIVRVIEVIFMMIGASLFSILADAIPTVALFRAC